MLPFVGPASLASLRWPGFGRVSLQPVLDRVAVELLAPEHAGDSLSLDVSPLRTQPLGGNVIIERIGFSLAFLKNAVKGDSQAAAVRRLAGQAQLNGPSLPRPEGAP